MILIIGFGGKPSAGSSSWLSGESGPPIVRLKPMLSSTPACVRMCESGCECVCAATDDQDPPNNCQDRLVETKSGTHRSGLQKGACGFQNRACELESGACKL